MGWMVTAILECPVSKHGSEQEDLGNLVAVMIRPEHHAAFDPDFHKHFVRTWTERAELRQQ